jgi:hypothetical protein
MPDLLPSQNINAAYLMQPMQGDVPLSQSNAGQMLLIGNDIALQWYAALTDKQQPVPQQIALPGGGVIPTAVVQQQGTILIIGLLVLGAVAIFAFSGR